ncbi:hypothetical protein ED352_09160 [Muribaculaceae bacterium Isolate-002 (NCI)]|nr:hypothetical protein ED352_09160 [Muribaculaceae bacterium Isolate-002 (NCI)]
MKKKIICAAAFIAAIIGASATVTWVGECGAEVITVSYKYFDNPIEIEEYYQELNQIYCGTKKGLYTIIRDDI